jgi:hypothetical protein
MKHEELEFASRSLLLFLAAVGPIEAEWAMSKAVSELQSLPPGADYQAQVANALAKAAKEEAGRIATDPAPNENEEEITPAEPGQVASDKPVDSAVEQNAPPEPLTKKTGKAS